MTSLRLCLLLALALLAASALGVSVVYVWARHLVIHVTADIDTDHSHVFVTNIALRVGLVMLIFPVLRWLANVETLAAWIVYCAGFVAILYPAVLTGLIFAGKAPHLNAVLEPGDVVPYGVVAVTYGLNLIGAAMFGALGWLFLRRLMPD